jgi:hypothetical protein
VGQVLGALEPLTHPQTTNRKWVSVSNDEAQVYKLQIVWEDSAVGSHRPRSAAKNGNYIETLLLL